MRSISSSGAALCWSVEFVGSLTIVMSFPTTRQPQDCRVSGTQTSTNDITTMFYDIIILTAATVTVV